MCFPVNSANVHNTFKENNFDFNPFTDRGGTKPIIFPPMTNFIFLLYLINTLYFKRTLNVSFFLGAGLFSWKKRRFGGHCAALNNYEKGGRQVRSDPSLK